MPSCSDVKKARNAAHYQSRKASTDLKRAYASALSGRVPHAATLERYGWGENELALIRAGDPGFRAALEEKYSLRLPQHAPTAAALDHQGLDPPPPSKGTGAAIT
jgi:hypothetical protein